MYKYYQHLGFSPIKHNGEGKHIHNWIFYNTPNLIKNCVHVNCFQDDFVVNNDKLLIQKREVITPIPDSMWQDTG